MTAEARRRAAGLGCGVAAGCAFAAVTLFSKQAYAAGVGVLTLAALRFLIAAPLLWAAFFARGAPRGPSGLPPSRRGVVLAFLTGGVAYALFGGAYLAAIGRLDASLAVMLLYAHPALVNLGAVLLGRDALDPLRLAALALATSGLALVLLGAGAGELDVLGVGLGLTAAVGYTAYLLGAAPVVDELGPALTSSLAATASALTLSVVAVASGSFSLPGSLAAWGWVAALAIPSTALAVGLLMAAMARVGPSTTSIAMTVEPVVGVALGVLLLGDRLGGAQVAGVVLVLVAIVVLQLGPRRAPAPSTEGRPR